MMMFEQMKKLQMKLQDLETKIVEKTKDEAYVRYVRVMLKVFITILSIAQNYPRHTIGVLLFLFLRFIALPLFWRQPIQTIMAIAAAAAAKWLLDYFGNNSNSEH